MSIQITQATVLLDTVTGLIVGTLPFTDELEAESFVNWIERNGIPVAEYRARGELDRLDTAQRWLTLMAEHREDACPYDRDVDTHGIGYTGDSDKSYGDGGTLATPDACGCECHTDAARQTDNGREATQRKWR